MRRIAVLALLPLLLAACNNAAEAPEAAETAAAAPAADLMLDLQATGIVVPAQGGAEQLDIPFGSARAAAEATIASVAGAVQSRGENAECGAGPMQMTEYARLTLNFQDNKFVGWFARAPYVPELPRSEMLADPAVALVDGSTLGEEFTIGAVGGAAGSPVISGLFADVQDTAVVEALWAGTNCLFR